MSALDAGRIPAKHSLFSYLGHQARLLQNATLGGAGISDRSKLGTFPIPTAFQMTHPTAPRAYFWYLN